MQTQLLRFCKDTAKVSSLPLLKITTKSTHQSTPSEEEDTNTVDRRRRYQYCGLKKKIPILWTEEEDTNTVDRRRRYQYCGPKKKIPILWTEEEDTNTVD